MEEKRNLSLLYKDEEEFLKDLNYVNDYLLEEFKKLEGKLNIEEYFKKYLDLNIILEEKLSKVFMFASMRSDLNKKNTSDAQDLQKTYIVYNNLLSTLSFADPEILKLGKKYVFNFLKKNPQYSQFKFEYERLFLRKKHILSKDKERLLSNFSSLSSTGSNLYSQITTADAKERECTLSNGKKVNVNLSNWSNLIEEADKEDDRTLIFNTLYEEYEEHKNTYGEIYNSVMQAEYASAKSRNFKSILESHLYYDKIPQNVFLSLIDVASTQNESLKKYLELKRKYLHLDIWHTYDRFVKLKKSTTKYTYEEAKELFYDSISKFDEDFKLKAHEVTTTGYVDVYPKLGKRTGAYSNGGSNTHPYILMNFEGSLEDVFTLAHESGHSIHTLYSMEAQPLMLQNYTIFVAEIASTFNEHNLLDYMLNKKDLSKNDKIALLEKSIDEIIGTFYRQALFGHYEYEVSKLVENDEPINYEVLSNIMKKLYKMYYGLDLKNEEYKKYVWAYIPHLFESPFYVYQYATSFTASMLIYEKVKNNEKDAFKNYIKMLRSGGSDYPINEVKLAGVDLTKKESYECVVKRMDELVTKLEKLLEE